MADVRQTTCESFSTGLSASEKPVLIMEISPEVLFRFPAPSCLSVLASQHAMSTAWRDGNSTVRELCSTCFGMLKVNQNGASDRRVSWNGRGARSCNCRRARAGSVAPLVPLTKLTSRCCGSIVGNCVFQANIANKDTKPMKMGKAKVENTLSKSSTFRLKLSSRLRQSLNCLFI